LGASQNLVKRQKGHGPSTDRGFCADVVIIGAGVCGCFIARELARYRLNIVLIEKEAEVCAGASRGNGGTIHSGVDPMPGTLKARLNAPANAAYEKIASDLCVPFKRVGSLVVATSKADLPHLHKLLERANKNGVPGVRITGPDEIRRLEPNVRALAALDAPTTAIVSPQRLVIALAENALANGVQIRLNTKCTGITTAKGKVVAVRTNRGRIPTRFVINAAGVHADEIAALGRERLPFADAPTGGGSLAASPTAGDAAWPGMGGFRIIPRKGEYYILDKKIQLIRRNIFPVPKPYTKGICVFPSVEGNNLVGPNSVVVEDKEDTSTTASAQREVFRFAKRFVPALSEQDIISAFAGIRATTESGDFIIGPTDVEGFINVAGIMSPGLTCAPLIAKMVADMIGERMRLVERTDFNPARLYPPRFADMSRGEKLLAIRDDPRCAHVICRCELVTEKEIVDAIHNLLGIHTMNFIKFTTRAGTGRCQGGFCGPRVVKIMARELGISPEELTLRGGESKLFAGGIKDLRLKSVLKREK
jgi:glycerol-3-phosphate dehydrogenase